MKVLQIVKTNEGANWAFNQAKWLHDNGVEIITVLPEINRLKQPRYCSSSLFDALQPFF